MSSRGRRKRAKRTFGFGAPQFQPVTEERLERAMKKVGELEGKILKVSHSIKPLRPSKPPIRKLYDLPPKTIIRRPKLLSPSTTLAIDPREEVIDLDELRKFGRYAIITRDDNSRKQFVVSDHITAAEEIENPDYAKFIQYNEQIEAANKKAMDAYERELMEYEKRNLMNEDGSATVIDTGGYESVAKEIGEAIHDRLTNSYISRPQTLGPSRIKHLPDLAVDLDESYDDWLETYLSTTTKDGELD